MNLELPIKIQIGYSEFDLLSCGFDDKTETEGFIGISTYMKENASVLEEEAKS